MNLSQLQYFQTVAQEEHISHAAEKLHISQPSLSATIHRIEEELDTPLFDRRGRNIYLNDNGQRLLDHVNYIFSQVNLLDKQLMNIKFKMSHCLTMAANNCMFLDDWLTKFIIANDNARISQVMMSEQQMLNQLLEEKIDIALGDFQNIPTGIVQHTLVPDEYIIVVPIHHPLAKKEAIYFSDIRNEPFVALSSNISYRIADKMFAQKSATPNIIFEGEQNMMFDILLQGRGLLFASRQMIYMRNTSKYKRNNVYQNPVEVRLLPIVDLNTKFNLSICWKENRELPIMAINAVQAFLSNYPKFTSDSSYCGKLPINCTI